MAIVKAAWQVTEDPFGNIILWVFFAGQLLHCCNYKDRPINLIGDLIDLSWGYPADWNDNELNKGVSIDDALATYTNPITRVIFDKKKGPVYEAMSEYTKGVFENF